jgi:hypothetical protein
MNIRNICSICIVFFTLIGMLNSPQIYAQQNESRSHRTEEILEIYQADQVTRSSFCKQCGDQYDRKIERIGDAQRRMHLFKMMVEDLPWNADELFYAASVLQSTDSVDTGVIAARKQKYKTQENHLLAFFLAQRAFQMGQQQAGPLLVSSIDSYLLASKMPKNFGLTLNSSTTSKTQQICLRSPSINDATRMNKEFPFALGESIKLLCSRSRN